ncbi:RNA 2'-phosphotransferase [Halopiger xanaduensis]|uniref:Probable RNA 2'-phosphotransferase n=1 Tax=Halopiger xanaduensis (strain DSM 18323 / JCM 14033 / SH-6) TaxID=797210 RepID=F8D5S1_HALXS|nr:RNA 2'-phosphotransferase [Halopiger xanaduensis]AEH36495.1 RNA 2'-phosphotransferase [Halopiger xanaduensis SH-6]
MTAPIRTCPTHGPFSADGGDDCPACGERGSELLSSERRHRLSKFMSGALRHFPSDAGIDLDERGWAAYEDLVAAVERKYDWADERHVAEVIATDPKGRFERTSGNDGERNRVRAAYGHSVDVDLEPTAAPVPDELYHGTAPENLEPIREEGLKPMSRQQVHLSESREAARQVGQRHAADPVVLVVDAAAMLADGHRITKRGEETYTTDAVPPAHLERVASA